MIDKNVSEVSMCPLLIYVIEVYIILVNYGCGRSIEKIILFCR